MEAFLDFTETISPTYRTAALVVSLMVFWMLESAIPLFSFSKHRIRHAVLNIFFTLTTLVVNFSLAFLLVASADYTTSNQIGVLYFISLPTWLHVGLGLMLLDLIGAYFIHWIEHRVRWLWKFHLIHHTDTHVDVTTGLRHHPGESVFRASFTILGVLVAGVPIGVVLIYQMTSVFFTQISHANIKSPPAVDRLLSYVFVTPNMHKVHHHFSQPLTDTNYGNVLSIWDRLFGTFAEVENTTDLSYGIDTHMKPEEKDELINLLAIPFQTYRAPAGSKFSDNRLNADGSDENR
ncbi:MAG: sterol desaturase family protein [Rhodothermia bacterium]|nr:MAG: sterol desaturase family protein [Rhodothermia bacterium]